MWQIHSGPYQAAGKAREVEKNDNARGSSCKSLNFLNLCRGIYSCLCTQKDGTLQFSVDFRKLNAVTVNHLYPISKVYECIESPEGATVFSTLEANNGYW